MARLGPAAAELAGLPVLELLERAGEGEIPSAILTAAGWAFSRDGLDKWRTRQARKPAA